MASSAMAYIAELEADEDIYVANGACAKLHTLRVKIDNGLYDIRDEEFGCIASDDEMCGWLESVLHPLYREQRQNQAKLNALEKMLHEVDLAAAKANSEQDCAWTEEDEEAFYEYQYALHQTLMYELKECVVRIE